MPKGISNVTSIDAPSEVSCISEDKQYLAQQWGQGGEEEGPKAQVQVSCLPVGRSKGWGKTPITAQPPPLFKRAHSPFQNCPQEAFHGTPIGSKIVL